MEMEDLEYELREAIPAHCFKVSTMTSLQYFSIDFFILASAPLVYPYAEMLGFVGLFLYWNVYGFFMFALFAIGHDCIHKTFSRDQWINYLVGITAMTPLLVPFSSMQRTHRVHHRFPNHFTKDKGHPWVSNRMKRTFSKPALFVMENLSPFLGLFSYLYLGLFDGQHIFPAGRIYRRATPLQKMRAAIEAGLIGWYVYMVWYLCEDVQTFFQAFLGCWFVFSWWAFMVTYMQRTGKPLSRPRVYVNGTWSMYRGVMQIVDHKIGYSLDALCHHMSDGACIHHIFPTEIPHYHLEEATQALRDVLDVKYQCVTHAFYLADFVQAFQANHHTRFDLITPRRATGRPTTSTRENHLVVANTNSLENQAIGGQNTDYDDDEGEEVETHGDKRPGGTAPNPDDEDEDYQNRVNTDEDDIRYADSDEGSVNEEQDEAEADLVSALPSILIRRPVDSTVSDESDVSDTEEEEEAEDEEEDEEEGNSSGEDSSEEESDSESQNSLIILSTVQKREKKIERRRKKDRERRRRNPKNVKFGYVHYYDYECVRPPDPVALEQAQQTGSTNDASVQRYVQQMETWQYEALSHPTTRNLAQYDNTTTTRHLTRYDTKL